jgi:UDP-4-amino-4,6-dideoxy-N-acetyl-beta-L-altrosamine N-acetyltransferase
LNASLRPVSEADRDRLRDWRNLPEVSRYMFTDHVIGAEEHARWFARMRTDETVRYWVIEVDGHPVGTACLTDIDLRQQRCSWGFYIAAPDVRGRGVGRFAGYTLLCHAFDQLALHEVRCEALDFNERALTMYRGLGFHEDGRLRERVQREGRLRDVVQLSLLAREWTDRRASIEAELRGRGFDLAAAMTTREEAEDADR